MALIPPWRDIDPADEFFSPYVYVHNDPVNFLDPDGKASNDFLGRYFVKLGLFIEKTKKLFLDAVGIDKKIEAMEMSDRLDQNKLNDIPKEVAIQIVNEKLGNNKPSIQPEGAYIAISFGRQTYRDGNIQGGAVYSNNGLQFFGGLDLTFGESLSPISTSLSLGYARKVEHPMDIWGFSSYQTFSCGCLIGLEINTPQGLSPLNPSNWESAGVVLSPSVWIGGAETIYSPPIN